MEHKMTYIEVIHDITTGETIEKPYSAEQLAEAKASEIAAKLKIDANAKAEADKAALLAKLGITADEAKLLLS
jgi:hypothetical protein